MRSHFLYLKRACARLTRVASAEAQATTGLHGAQAQALLVLSEMDECRISDLGNRLDLGKPATTTLVERMEKENLVSRESDQNDARVRFVRLTPDGREAVGSVARMISAFDAKLLDGFNPQEIEVIERYLDRAIRLEGL